MGALRHGDPPHLVDPPEEWLDGAVLCFIVFAIDYQRGDLDLMKAVQPAPILEGAFNPEFRWSKPAAVSKCDRGGGSAHTWWTQ